MSGSRELTPNQTLSGVAVRFRNHKLIADEIAPVYEVPSVGANYIEFGSSEEFDEYETQVASDEGSVTESKGTRTLRSYTTLDFSHKQFIPTLVEEENQILGLPEIDLAVERVTNVVLRKREIFVAGQAASSANYTGAYTTTPGTKWGTATVKQIITDVNTGVDALAAPGDGKIMMALGLQAWRSISTNANLIANVVPTKAVGQLTLEQVAELLQIDGIVVGQAKKTTVGSATKTNIWGDIALIYQQQQPSMVAEGHVQCFRKKVKGQYVCVYIIPDPNKGAHGGTWIKVSITEKPYQILNGQAGYLLTAISA